MDDTLRAHYVAILINKKTVLILVLMDDTLRESKLSLFR